MISKLVSTSGPLRGSVFPLATPEVGIGRDTSNRIAIGDARVSRAHAVLRPNEDGEVVLVDLKSLNGTFVNGVPIGERVLVHGDQIEIGGHVFIFLKDEPAAEARADSVSLRLLPPRHTPTVALSPEEVRLLAPARAAAEPSARVMRALAQLLEATRALHTAPDTATWTKRLIQHLLETLPPAQRVAVMLRGEGGALESLSAGGRGSAGECTMVADEGLVRRVLAEGVALLGEVPAEETEAEAAGASRWAAAAPLQAAAEAQGVLYVDAPAPFAPDDLEVLAAFAAVAAGALENVRHVEWLAGERQRLSDERRLEHEMVGESPPMRRLYDTVARVAATDSTVLLLGESGTGKELLARSLHANSPRAQRAFIAINCAALTETLLESELFGHERGAFTGAVARKAGKLEAADGGTLFLDEVGEMSPALQSKLLRALETRQFERVGGTASVRVDVRIVAATNRDLEAAVKQGAFRPDLYYRLNVVSLRLPPLRERRDDIPLLARYFAAQSARKVKRPLMGLAPEARAVLLRYSWPGNVRELQNAIERAVVLGEGDLIRPEDLPESLLEEPGTVGESGGRYHEALLETKTRLIRQAVEEAQGSIVQAAALLGLHPNYLHRLMRNLGLKGGER